MTEINALIPSAQAEEFRKLVLDNSGTIIHAARWHTSEIFFITRVPAETHTIMALKYGEKIWPR